MDTIKFVWLCGGFLTFCVSLLLVSTFWKKETVRLAGFYAILPGLNMLGVTFLLPWTNFKQTVIVSIVIDVVIIIQIVYFFRELYKAGFFIPWILLVFEIFRSALLILYSLSSRSMLTSFEADLYYFYYIVPFVLLIYCVFIPNESSKIQRVTH